MSEHTPGPWSIFILDGEFTILPSGRPGEVAARIRNECDADLIRAAPDMLAALRAIANTEPQSYVTRLAKAAIAKAEGTAR